MSNSLDRGRSRVNLRLIQIQAVCIWNYGRDRQDKSKKPFKTLVVRTISDHAIVLFCKGKGPYFEKTDLRNIFFKHICAKFKGHNQTDHDKGAKHVLSISKDKNVSCTSTLYDVHLHEV